MKITSIETAVIQGNFDWVLVRIETDAGVTGLGEAYWGVGVAELVHKAAPVLIGEDPFNVGKLYEVMIRCMSGEGSLAGAPRSRRSAASSWRSGTSLGAH